MLVVDIHRCWTSANPISGQVKQIILQQVRDCKVKSAVIQSLKNRERIGFIWYFDPMTLTFVSRYSIQSMR